MLNTKNKTFDGIELDDKAFNHIDKLLKTPYDTETKIIIKVGTTTKHLTLEQLMDARTTASNLDYLLSHSITQFLVHGETLQDWKDGNTMGIFTTLYDSFGDDGFICNNPDWEESIGISKKDLMNLISRRPKTSRPKTMD